MQLQQELEEEDNDVELKELPMKAEGQQQQLEED